MQPFCLGLQPFVHIGCLFPISVGVAGLGNLLGGWPQVHTVNLERPSTLPVWDNVAGGAKCDSWQVMLHEQFLKCDKWQWCWMTSFWLVTGEADPTKKRRSVCLAFLVAVYFKVSAFCHCNVPCQSHDVYSQVFFCELMPIVYCQRNVHCQSHVDCQRSNVCCQSHVYCLGGTHLMQRSLLIAGRRWNCWRLAIGQQQLVRITQSAGNKTGVLIWWSWAVSTWHFVSVDYHVVSGLKLVLSMWIHFWVAPWRGISRHFVRL